MPERRHMILCTVTDIRDGQVVYPCCSHCCSKLRSDCFQDRWQCLKCGSTSSSDDLEWRYRLSLMVSDGSALTNICLFGSMLHQFFGMPSNQFVRFLQKIESMYGNSKEILLLGLKQCFIGQHYYFGVKAKASAGKENTRIKLEDIIEQKHSACQNTLFSQEDYLSTVAFQMVSAVERDTKTVYEIIRNFFKGSTDETVNIDKACSGNYGSSNTSTMQRSKIGTKLFERSESEQSHVTLGQTTALLSCEMSDFEETCLKSTSKSKSMSSCKKRNQESANAKNHLLINFTNNESEYFGKIGICRRNIFKRNLDDSKNYPSGDNPEESKVQHNDKTFCNGIDFKENIIASRSEKNTTFDSASSLKSDNCCKENECSSKLFSDQLILNPTNDLKDYLKCFETDMSCKKSSLTNTNSETLFSQDNDSFNCPENSLRTKEDSIQNHLKYQRNHLKDRSISLEGTLLLQNLKVPDIPENVPDSEELDLYLFNDSSFDLEVGNLTHFSGEQNMLVADKNTNSVNQNLVERTERNQMINSENKNLKRGIIPDNISDDCCIQISLNSMGEKENSENNMCRENIKNSSVDCESVDQNKCLEECDQLFEDSFEDFAKSQHFEDHSDMKTTRTNTSLHLEKDMQKKVQSRFESELKKTSENTQIDVCRREQSLMSQNCGMDGETETIDSDDFVLACAPELSDHGIEDLSREFDKNLITNFNLKVDRINFVAKSMCVDTGDQKEKRIENSSVENFESGSDLILESQQIFNTCNKQETNETSLDHFAGQSQSLISESMYADASADLFGESPRKLKNSSVHHYGDNRQENKGCWINPIKSSKKSVKFSRRLSCHKSVQLIDLQMKINSNPVVTEADGKVLKKSCLKQGIGTIVESNESFSYSKKMTNIMKSVENSPIQDNNLVPLSQDLFSPSPDICFKKPKALSNKLITSRKFLLKSDEKPACGNNRHSSTPIEEETVNDEQYELISKSFISMFSDTFEDDYDKENKFSHDHLNKMSRSSVSYSQSARSPSLFSNSCSLFSSYSKLSEKGNNISCYSNCSSVRGDNVVNSHSNNFSCDLFSPSGYESCHSPQAVMPVKRLFLDKL